MNTGDFKTRIAAIVRGKPPDDCTAALLYREPSKRSLLVRTKRDRGYYRPSAKR
jgi:hypothetical protein